MHTENLAPWTHSHEFATVDAANERRTVIVVWLTMAMMVVEITAGVAYGSMALLADGWHMGTHVAALGISVLAYRYARRHARDPRFTFGTGKVGVLGGFASAVALAVIALVMAAESVQRFFSQPAIRFDEAILVALVGLAVNVASAIVLSGRSRGGTHTHADTGVRHTHDHNLRAAYLHVVADALTSVFAVVALSVGKYAGLTWLDPMMGIVGGAVIASWAYGLVRDTGNILVDAGADKHLFDSVRAAIESADDNRLSDLHVWRVGPTSYAAILCVVTEHPRPPEHYRNLLAGVEELAHVSIEIRRCPGA